MREEKILVIGACGQLGRELTLALKEKYGKKAVIACDRLEPARAKVSEVKYIRLDVMNKAHLQLVMVDEKVTQVYLLAAMLSASGEKDPSMAWQVNMDGLLNVLELSVRYGIAKVFWPSSIAVFGPESPKINCGQHAFTIPTTVYGISKLSGEYWCRYYFEKFGLDVRSLRYPGLVSHKALPGGGTTDYAVDIFYKANAGEKFSCFLKPDTALPMMFMDDAVRATLELMDAPRDNISVRTSYNLSSVSFTPAELAAEIRKVERDFQIVYLPDFRQEIADSWPASINDDRAREDWGWSPRFGTVEIVKVMLENVNVEKVVEVSAT
ncbi:NAD-dependent epimerase/dehydratase family protein [Pedobacter sp. LMG 31464]|uniref:NAD-dependent epimerase/dehydratase family protein n=1 Tax=Pedobacter planticolens TaxID=2679964 RepID=A0A923E1R9_9SPHI|nr:NAD-dependent epimerase/dehydratase family protein [Pedobacter planticolens]MBB2146798.1 NAD-dependent epimerase/dehydratase family protein [Pedobacter planticolens]